jgi:2-amino-4-hydroxy-6-hydroxymethyldihydropteridine diphosphokinase
MFCEDCLMADIETPPQSDIVYLGLGSNMEPERHLQAGVTRLQALGEIVAVSSVYQSKAYGYTDRPDYLNVAVGLRTALDPLALKLALREIERELGRDRATQATPHGPLTLDIDMLLWGERAFTFGDKPWRVPDKDTATQAAIAIPLAEIAPDAVHPDAGEPMRAIAVRLEAAGTSLRRTSFRVVID